MKVAMNMMTLRGFGSRHVGLGVLSGLTCAGTCHQLDIWAPDSWSAQDFGALPGNFSLHMCRPGTYHKFVTENVALRRSLNRQRPDCLFSLGDTSLVAANLPHLLMVQQAYMAYPFSEMDFAVPLTFRLKLRAMAAYFRLGLPTVTLFTVQSQVMARRLSQRWGIASDRIAVVPSSIVLPKVESVTTPRYPPYLCYVASASAHKNHEVLAAMMFELVQEWRVLKCYLTVTPEQVPSLAHRIQQLHLEDNFVFCGALPYKAAIELMRHSWACVIPSKLESFGLPYFEAMAQGCPVIAADRDFARDACGEAGLYADANSGASFAECVSQVLSSRDAREEWGERSRVQFRSVYHSWADISQQYLAVLQSIT